MSAAPLVFAFFAGAVASANPCGFAILPAFFLSFAASSEVSRADARRRVAQALLAGASMTAAFALVFGVVGTGLAAGAMVLMPAMPWATIVVGVALAVLGLLVLSGRHVSLRLPDPVGGRSGGYRGPFLFGVGYGVASLSCTLPVFLSVVGASLAGNVLLVRAGIFMAYAVGMGTMLTALALAAALAGGGVQRSLRRLAPFTSRVGGVFLVAAGLYLIYYWTFFLLPGSARRTAGKGPIDFMNRVAERIQNWLAFGGGAWVARFLFGVILALSAAAVWWGVRARGRRRAGPTAGDGGTRPEEREFAAEGKNGVGNR